MFRSGFRLGSVLMLACFVGLLVAAPASSIVITPESVRGWFDLNFMLLALLFGVVYKYWQPLAGWNNQLINWIQLAGYMLTRLAGGAVAHAAGPDLGGAAVAGALTFADTLLWGLVHTRLTREAYEFLVRPLLEGVFKLKKAVPKPA